MSLVLSVAWFSLCAAALALTGWTIGRRHPEASVTALFDAVMSDRTIRITILVMWWWLGWHFLAGQTVDPPA